MKRKFLLIPLLCMPFLLASCDLRIQRQVTKEVVTVEGDEIEVMRIKNSITDVYNLVSPSCVGLYCTSDVVASIGSGVIYKYLDGYYYVVTNHHVIDGKTDFKVYDGIKTYYDATLIGSDATNDVAVLKFSTDVLGEFRDFKPMEILSNDVSDTLTIGQTVVAVGCPLDIENYNSVTSGIISRFTREQITTDTALNPGNSGGGLFNMEGRLVGLVNSGMVWTQSENGNVPVEGEGYAISLYILKASIRDIEEKQTSFTRPLMGIRVFTVNTLLGGESYEKVKDYLPSGEGENSYVVIAEVTMDSPAYKAGLLANDVILTINDEKIYKTAQIGEILHVLTNSSSLTVVVYRSGTLQTINLSFE